MGGVLASIAGKMLRKRPTLVGIDRNKNHDNFWTPSVNPQKQP